jgi:SHS family sialic acid transporter-like MFS transporter
MGESDGRGRWIALAAALLGWMFDGLEMGLFPLVARPALRALLLAGAGDDQIGRWFSIATAAFLVGAATGGVLFGWLGDRIGRVRAMTLSVLTYAIFSGLCGLATSAVQVVGLRFIAALGMGGEWSLGVALVMEVWPDGSRALLAGMIGAAANFGYMLIAIVSLILTKIPGGLHDALLATGLAQTSVDWLTANSAWRLLMLLGATPAVLTFFIRLFVPESKRWEREQLRGSTSQWMTVDLIGPGIGATAALLMLWLWAVDFGWELRLTGTAVALLVVTAGYLYPVARFLDRSTAGKAERRSTLGHMLLGAALSGVALLGTWASIQWAPTWADQLTGGKEPNAKAFTQICMAVGAVIGSLGGALLAGRIGRRWAYCLLCLGSLASTVLFFRTNDAVNSRFLATVFLAGGLTASFYGWLPLYLPELFGTQVRATGQGFSFNFGRILAAVGALQTGALTKQFGDEYSIACSWMSLIYLVGLGLIWLAPETRGKPLPE